MATHELRLGEKAPAFTLKDQAGQTVRLADFRGHKSVILIFYPGDMTPGCTIQLCAVRDDWSKFKDSDLTVFGVNHAKAESHAEFSKKFSFPFPLLVDSTKRVSAAYGAVRKIFSTIIIRRSVIGIDAGGIIRYIKRGMPKNADILKAMKPYAHSTQTPALHVASRHLGQDARHPSR